MRLNVVVEQVNLAIALIANREPADRVKLLLDDAHTRLTEILMSIGGGANPIIDDEHSG
ncbi:MAG: hypothetical protein SGI92_10340 [Bryobacteraceae bacterium]|nr:hypothetical protein [Bryobacteraceae bacterium]